MAAKRQNTHHTELNIVPMSRETLSGKQHLRDIMKELYPRKDAVRSAPAVRRNRAKALYMDAPYVSP